MLHVLYRMADRLKLYLEQSSDCVIRNLCYKGWTYDYCVGTMLVCAPNGVVITCVINAPVAMQASVIA